MAHKIQIVGIEGKACFWILLLVCLLEDKLFFVPSLGSGRISVGPTAGPLRPPGCSSQYSSLMKEFYSGDTVLLHSIADFGPNFFMPKRNLPPFYVSRGVIESTAYYLLAPI